MTTWVSHRTSKENLSLEKDENGDYTQPWAWLIGCKIVIVDYNDEGKIQGIGIEDPEIINPLTGKPAIHWIGYYVKPILQGGHFYVQ